MGAAPLELASRFDSHSIVGEAEDSALSVLLADREITKNPQILVATTGSLPSTARLVMELHEAGAQVSFIGPRNHPADVLSFIGQRLTYRASSPSSCLEAAILRLKPDFVIACDERTVRDMQTVWRLSSHEHVRALIEKSSAPQSSYATITSRAALLSLARDLGVRVPVSAGLQDARALDRWIAMNRCPFVLKADGSWAGFGVRIISDAAVAEETFADMTRPITLRLALREALLEGNYFGLRDWWRRERPAMSVQGYIDGWPANIGVACWQGEVLATSCAEAVATRSATGPSTVARIIQSPEMVDFASRLVKALGISGFVGFDFMIEAATGAAYLIEMNPRNTPICTLPLGPGHDLPEAFVARLAGRPPRERPPRTERDIIAYFPDTWRLDPSNQFLQTGFHDVPWQQPELVRVLMRPELRDRYLATRIARRLWRKIHTETAS